MCDRQDFQFIVSWRYRFRHMSLSYRIDTRLFIDKADDFWIVSRGYLTIPVDPIERQQKKNRRSDYGDRYFRPKGQAFKDPGLT